MRDITEVRTAEGKLHLFVAIDRVTKFAFVQLHEKATRRLPGGRVLKGELLRDAAVRKAWSETGIGCRVGPTGASLGRSI